MRKKSPTVIFPVDTSVTNPYKSETKAVQSTVSTDWSETGFILLVMKGRKTGIKLCTAEASIGNLLLTTRYFGVRLVTRNYKRIPREVTAWGNSSYR